MNQAAQAGQANCAGANADRPRGQRRRDSGDPAAQCGQQCRGQGEGLGPWQIGGTGNQREADKQRGYRLLGAGAALEPDDDQRA